MWGTTPACAKLTGDSGNGFEAALIGDCLLLRPLAGNQPQCLLRLLQQNRHLADIRFWSMSALRVARIRSVERLPVFCYFHPTLMRRMARSVSRAMADGWSVSARTR